MKKLEISGFKSFADKIALELEPGITAIVGPNGAGKSNIADSIRWAMGEQSVKSLRGNRMEDVIFAGSQKRKALSLAEVTITLDNSQGKVPLDFSEISVTRRVDRSGEGQYFLNRAPCRLKDIYDIFADTGLGRDAYYSVGQGKIDEILSTHSEDRRGLIEEAAGIVRYRSRKREALRKMEHTARNLERVTDIIEELSSQLGPLEEQAEKAKEYKVYDDELTTLQMALTVEEALKAKETLAQLELKIETLSERMDRAQREHDEAEVELDRVRGEHEALGRKETRLQDDLQAARVNEERASAQLDGLKDKIEDLKEEIARVTLRIDSLREEAEQARQAEARDRDGLGVCRTEVEAVTALVRERQEEVSRLSSEAKHLKAGLEAGRSELIDLLNERSRLINRAEALRLKRETVRRQMERVRNKRAGLEKELKDVAGQERAGDEVAGETKTQMEQAQKEVGRLRKLVEEVSLQKEEVVNRARLAAERISSVNSRLGALREMENSLEGFNPGPRNLLRAAKKDRSFGQGVLGPVARLIQVKRGREKAIEAALGSAAQHIVVKSQQDAKKAIEYLRATRSGRATFLPLDLLRPGSINPAEREKASAAGALGTALEMVDRDNTALKALEFLLGRVLVAPNLEVALTVGRSVGLRYKIVTLDGDVIWPGGSMAGGSPSSGRQQGLLSRAEEIARLEEESLGMKADLQGLEVEAAAVSRQLAEANGHLQDAEKDVREKERALSVVLGQASSAKRERQRLETEIQGLEWEEAQALEDGQEGEEGDAGEVRQRLDEREGSIREKLGVVERDLASKEEELAEATERLNNTRVEEAKRLEVLRSMEGALATRVQARVKAEGEAREKDGELASLRERLGRAEERMGNLHSEVEESGGIRRNIEEQLGQVRETLEKRMEASSELERRLKRLRRNLAQSSSDLNSLAVDKARVDTELSSVLRHLMADHGLTLEVAFTRITDLEERGALLSFDEIPRRQAELKALLEEMGPVNLGAPEEYKRVKERHGFLEEQKKDLIDSRKTLEKLVQEIDESMKDLFLDTFGKVRIAFRGVFQDLFNGGNADLILTDKSNLLETGVEISAQPPGRKTQGLSLLSGGERALTAIALLFALLTVKPSPFVVLDEIEAALDDANVQRFTRMLRAFSGNTQFIMVTHQRGTMQAARALYGVTMEESGVSKMVSVRLVDEEVAG